MKIASGSIDNLSAFQNDSMRVRKTDATAGIGGVQPTSNTASASVSLSSASALAATGSSDIDTAKVESIKAALRDGTYKIDSGNIASGMLSSVSELLKG